MWMWSWANWRRFWRWSARTQVIPNSIISFSKALEPWSSKCVCVCRYGSSRMLTFYIDISALPRNKPLPNSKTCCLVLLKVSSHKGFKVKEGKRMGRTYWHVYFLWIEFIPYAFQLLAQLLDYHHGTNLPDMYVGLLNLILNPTLWEQGNIPALVRLLEAYLSKGSDTILSSNRLEPILGIFQQKLVGSRQNDHYAMSLLSAITKAVPM